jgi:hypothetical protein
MRETCMFSGIFHASLDSSCTKALTILELDTIPGIAHQSTGFTATNAAVNAIWDAESQCHIARAGIISH